MNDQNKIGERVIPIRNRLFNPSANMRVTGRIVACLTSKRGNKKWIEAENQVTNAGDLFYAERAVQTVPPTNFTNTAGAFDGVIELGSTAGDPGGPYKSDTRATNFTAIASTEKAMTAGYPKINDGDADNTGAGVDVVTYLASYTTGDFNHSAITEVIITNPSPGTAEPILMYAWFTAFEKTANDTLKMFVNHTMNGT